MRTVWQLILLIPGNREGKRSDEERLARPQMVSRHPLAVERRW